MINYSKRINTKREFYPIGDINFSSESDRGRIISSASFRRLQKRTQVFALELNAAVRSRLTHSLEVSQTSRYIAKTVLNLIEEEGKLKEYKLKDLESAFVSISEMASLLHDIGNPPFGHFAEMAINDWMKKEVDDVFQGRFGNCDEELSEKLQRDLLNFDGNAQAIRIVAKLQRMNLSYSQIASILKYTRGAYESKPAKDDELSYLKKKGGFFYSEKEIVEKFLAELEIARGHRFPITYIMEAADDISYLIADLEDAVDKGILKKEEIIPLIEQESDTLNQKLGTEDSFLVDIVKKSYERSQKEDKPYQFDLFLTLTKAYITNHLVKYVSTVFVENHERIFDGSFNHALIDFDKNDKHSLAVKILQNVSVKHIYSNKDVETLELKGHTIITGLLDAYKRILDLSYGDMQKLLRGERISCYLSQRLFKRLSKKHIASYSSSVETLEESSGKKMLEWYYRARLIIDYISGMTDDFALNEYKTLTVS